jgi:transposase InsO family protein
LARTVAVVWPSPFLSDITYLATAEGWVYLAVVLDLFSRKVVGWSLARSLETTLVAEALRQAIEARRPVGKEYCITAIAARSTPATLTERP